MSNLKRMTIWIIIIVLSIIPLGCSGTTSTTASGMITSETGATVAPTSSSDQEIKIAMTWWGDTKRNEVYNTVIDLFEKENPNIKVDRPFGTWAEYFDKLSTQIAGGTAPDVIGMHQRFVSEYALRGALLDLQPYVDSGVIDTSNIPESILKNGYIGDKLYMISQGVTGSGIGYNTNTFDTLSISYPDMNWTYDEFTAKLKELKAGIDQKNLDIWPCADLTIDIYSLNYWVRAYGQHMFNEDGTLGFTEDVLVKYFQYWKDLRDQGLICDAATTSEFDGLPAEQSLFGTSKVAIMQLAASQIGLYQTQIGDQGIVDLVRFPHVDGQPNPEFLSGAFYTINAKSANPEAAAKLINFYVNNTEGQKIFKIEQGLPPATTAVEAIQNDLSESEVKSAEFIQNQLIKYASPEPYPPKGYAEITSNYKTIALSVAFGELTPEEAAAKMISNSNEILSQK